MVRKRSLALLLAVALATTACSGKKESDAGNIQVSQTNPALANGVSGSDTGMSTTGVTPGTQQDLVQRALRLGRTSVREVMIAWNRVIGVPAAISQDGFRAMVKRYNVSRMPVLGSSTTEVLGIVDVLDALAPRPAPAPFRVTEHLHPPMTLIGEQSVRSAITLMQRARQTIAIVVDRHGRAIGLVTMKDLIEELVGDLENW